MPRIFAVKLKDEPAERYEQWVNTPVYTHDYEDCVGWLGCELPEDGHSCEFAELAGDGSVTCVSSSKVNQLRSENAKLREERDYLLMNSNPTATELRRVRRAWKNDRDKNAKLREFATLAWQIMTHNEPLHVWKGMVDDARELGIEVDDDRG